ncbi:MAG TPA: SDR family oxidoreductase [Planctomycetota bacterium]|nr:SDR family oxidoreductase [Planctomycetota bacterium]
MLRTSMASPTAPPVTIVTGASRGIGRAIAEALANAGHQLVLVARDESRLATLVAELAARGARAMHLAADLRDEDAAAGVVAATERHFGAPTVVVSNAGTAPTDKVENTTRNQLRETFALHVAAPLAFARACVPAMRRRGSGCLLHLASTAGLRGFPFTAAYTAAKHGMVGLARALHAELAPAGISVYAVCPGFVDSDITRNAAAAIAARGKTTAEQALARMAQQNRIGRLHSTAEVAGAVAVLLNDRPTGCVYDLDRDPPAFVDREPKSPASP